MSMNGYLPMITTMVPTSGLFGSQQCSADNVGASDDNAGNTPSKDTQFGQPANQFHPPPPLAYSYPPSQPPFPGAPPLYHQASFNTTPSSQPSSSVTQWYPSYGPSWQAYDFPQGGYGGPQLFPPEQFTGHGLSSPGAHRVPPAPPGNNPVIRPTSSAFSAPGQLPGAPDRPPMSLPTKRFQPAVEPRRTDVARITDLPPLPDISYDKYDSDYESDGLLDLGRAEGKAPIILKQTEFSLNQFATRMGQPNFSTFNKWKKVLVAGFLEKTHRSIIRGQNSLKQLPDGPLQWETVVADLLETLDMWLPLETFDNAEWIQPQWVEMVLKKCSSEVREARKKGRRGNSQPATDLGERMGNQARGNLPELPNTTFMVVIRRVPNGNNAQTLSNKLQACYTDVRH